MNPGKIFCAFGLGLGLASLASGQPDPKVVVCSPNVVDCTVQALKVSMAKTECDKHGTSNPTALASGTTGTPVEQPCKGITKPESTTGTGQSTGPAAEAKAESKDAQKSATDSGKKSGPTLSLDIKKD